jgi:hypothetical protein
VPQQDERGDLLEVLTGIASAPNCHRAERQQFCSNTKSVHRIYFLLLLNKTNGKTNKTNDQKEKEKSKGKSKEKDGEHGGSGGRRKERDEEREEGQDVDVLSEHALERYFEKLFFDYQQVT